MAILLSLLLALVVFTVFVSAKNNDGPWYWAVDPWTAIGGFAVTFLMVY